MERICTETVTKYAKRKDILKAVKKELHIIHGSYLPDNCCCEAEALIDGYTGDNIKMDKGFAAQLMALHVSTRERLGQAVDIYPYLNRFIQAEDIIIDIGCGFNPFALPFYNKWPKSYIAYDICLSTICMLTKYFELTGLPYRAEILDAVSQIPEIQGDVALMFKLFPLLDRQKKGRAFELLNLLSFRTAIISFPIKSASGREKGMEAFYSSHFEGGLQAGFNIVDKAVFENELFYIVSGNKTSYS